MTTSQYSDNEYESDDETYIEEIDADNIVECFANIKDVTNYYNFIEEMKSGDLYDFVDNPLQFKNNTPSFFVESYNELLRRTFTIVYNEGLLQNEKRLPRADLYKCWVQLCFKKTATFDKYLK